MTANAEIGHPEINVIKIKKAQLKELVRRCIYRSMGYSGIGAFYVRGHADTIRPLKRACRREDYRDAKNS
jgi:hypothetical protein